MADRSNKLFNNLVSLAKSKTEDIDLSAIAAKAAKTTANLTEDLSAKADALKEGTITAKNDITDKLTELDRMLEQSITEYNDAYTLMNDKGIKLFVERSRAVDSIAFVENLVNSIANRPKSFDADFEEIDLSDIFSDWTL